MEGLVLPSQGAEARIYECFLLGRACVVKERFAKQYRHVDLDRQLRSKQLANELRSILRCSRAGVAVPTLLWVDKKNSRMYMEKIDGVTVKKWLQEREDDFGTGECLAIAQELGTTIAKIHCDAGMIHGDLTTSNFMITRGTPIESNDKARRIFVIDFGLSQMLGSAMEEDCAVDLYVLERAMVSTHPKSENLFLELLKSYREYWAGGVRVVTQLDEVRQRGRKKIAFG